MRAIRLVRASVVAVAALAGATLPASGCDGGNTLKLCGEIPANGCPIGRGGSCDDALCKGLYDCVEGKWTLAVDCAADGGMDAGGSGGGGSGGADAACTPVVLSHEGELTGCQPDLQAPDCPVVAAEAACMQSVCLTGCTDFFLCIYNKDQANERSWSAVAHCDDQGQLMVAP